MIPTRPYYEDYVNHMLRHYCRYADRMETLLDGENKEDSGNHVDVLNAAVCDRVVCGLSGDDRKILFAIYTSDGWYAPKVSLYQIMRDVGITDTQAAMRLVRKVSVEIKELRGL